MKFKQALVQSGMIVVFVLVVIGARLITPVFLSKDNMISLGLQVSSIAMVSCTMLFCLAAGDFDLSVGSVFALGGMVGVIVANDAHPLAGPVAVISACLAGAGAWALTRRFYSGVPVAILAAILFARGGYMAGLAIRYEGVLAGWWVPLLAGIFMAIATGAGVGLLNGVIVAQFRINALITTLATMQIARGLTNILGHGMALSASKPGFDFLGDHTFFTIPLPILLMALCFIVFGLLLNYTVFGRNTLAVGGNREAALLAGIRVTKTKIAIFMLSGMVAAFAGLVAASRLQVASNNAGDKLELQAISACVLGGVSLSGGIGTISGTVVGVLIMGIVENVMRLKSVDAFYQMVVTGTILLLAVLFDRAKLRLLNSGGS